jgi:large subunit ribosomal protein L22
MTGPKLNEGSFVAGERSGTKASAQYLRVSAYKARVVLNLIRDLPVKNADEVLQFSDREVSNDIRKVLASAVANAQHNDEQDPDELFVKACFADEGPTLKRFTPRARGRGNRINKRTCHITIVVARLDDRRLEVVQAREAKRTAAGRRGAAAGGTTASRRARVERSRKRAVEAATGGTADAGHDHDHGHDHDETHGLIDASAFTDLPAGAHAPLDDGSQPEGYDIKGNADSMLYHLPDTAFYNRTVAEVWFDTAESAEAAGYQLPPSQRNDEDAEASDAGEENN